MEELEKKFKGLLIQSLDNENEAARELAAETAVKVASNFTEEQLKRLLAEFSTEHLHERLYTEE